MLIEFSTPIPLVLAIELSDKIMWIWVNRNTEERVGGNNYHSKKNYSLLSNEESTLADRSKLEQTILELCGI